MRTTAHTTPTTWHTDYRTTTLHCTPPRHTDYHITPTHTDVRVRQGRLVTYYTIPHITTTEGRVLRQRIDYQATPTLDVWVAWASGMRWAEDAPTDAQDIMRRVMHGMPTDTDIVRLQEWALAHGV